MDAIKNVLITGGTGFVGCVLVPRLLREGYHVKALDLHLYSPIGILGHHPNLEEIHGDIRDVELLKRILPGTDAVIHLACISNDPDYNLNPALSKKINYDSFPFLVEISKAAGVRRFIYASSSSVYGIQDNPRVTEDLPLKPLTDYAKYKGLCEEVLFAARAPSFTALALRPATISGYSPRFRMDVVVNVLTMSALAARRITVHGGQQMRANLHMADMVNAYCQSLLWPDELIDGQVFNIGAENFHICELAERIRRMVGNDVRIDTLPVNDPRSYSLCSDKIKRVLRFQPTKDLDHAVRDLQAAWRIGAIQNPLENDKYYNVRWLKRTGLK